MIPRDSWRIDLNRTAFLTIDVQRAYLEPGAPLESSTARSFIPKINELADICRKLDIPVIHIYNSVRADLVDAGLKQELRPRTESEWETVDGRKGVELYPDLKVDAGDYTLKKVRYSAFIPGSSSLQPVLSGLGRDSFVVCGGATDVCLGATVQNAMMLGYRVFVIGDLTFTFSEERQKIGLEVLHKHFAKVITFEETKKELQQLKTTV